MGQKPASPPPEEQALPSPRSLRSRELRGFLGRPLPAVVRGYNERLKKDEPSRADIISNLPLISLSIDTLYHMNLEDLIRSSTASLQQEWRANLEAIGAIGTIILAAISLVPNFPTIYRLLSVACFISVAFFYAGFRFALYRSSRTTVAIEGCIRYQNVLWKGQLRTKRGDSVVHKAG